MKSIITFLTLLTISQISNGQNTILWKVTDTINNKTSFVIGTFHQFGNSFVDSIPQIKESLLNSEIAVFESIDKIENTRKLIEERQASLEIETMLRKRDLRKLKIISKHWKVDLYKLKPLEIRWKLQQEFQKAVCKTSIPTDQFDHFDKYLQHIAEQNQIKLIGLETDSIQLNLIEKVYKYPNWKKERKNIAALIKKITTSKANIRNCGLAIKYRKFDLNYEFQQECKSDILILKRNNHWMKIIPDILKTNNTFIAVGYFHLKNKCGILEQLKNKGFEVEAIELKPVSNNI